MLPPANPTCLAARAVPRTVLDCVPPGQQTPSLTSRALPLSALQQLDLRECAHITKLEGLASRGFKALTHLNLSGCYALKNLQGLQVCPRPPHSLRGVRSAAQLPAPRVAWSAAV